MNDLLQHDATDLLSLIARKEASAEEVMAVTYDRIEAVNGELNAIVALREREEALARARMRDLPFERHGPLHGLPMAVKDLVGVAELRTTYGSPIFADHVPRRDDLLARRLREAGAILIGKTNTPEFGLGSHTFNPVHGTTANPHDTSKTAGGSSGGAAAAVASHMLAMADGSDMMGSLRNPAAFCGIYGFRPTWGTVPSDVGGRLVNDGALHQLATDGPMARTPRDLALLLDVLTEPDGRFPFARRTRPSFAKDIRPGAKLTIGWLGNWDGAFPCEDGIEAICEAALDRLGAAGARWEPVYPDFDPERVWRAWLTLRAFATLARLKPLHDDPTKRAQLKPEAIWEIEQGLALTPTEINAASTVRAQFAAEMARLFETYDVLALPSAQVWPFSKTLRHPERIGERRMDTYHRWMAVVVPVSLLGLPAVGVPVGFGSDGTPGAGLPMGMQLFAPRGEDQRLLDAAAAWEEMRAG